ncbi:MAG: hypothetical protein WCO18_00920 [bacterium]
MCTQLAYGDVGLITGDDANNVVVSGTSWTAEYKDGYDGGNMSLYEASRVVLYEPGAFPSHWGYDSSLVVFGNTHTQDNGNKYDWAVGTYTFALTYDGAANLYAFVNGLPIDTSQSLLPVLSVVNPPGKFLQITIFDQVDFWGGGWSMTNLEVNGVSLPGYWSAIGTWGLGNGLGSAAEAPTVVFYIDLDGQRFQSISFDATLHPMDLPADIANGTIYPARGDPLGIAISNVSVVPEPSSFILVIVSGVALLLSKYLLKQNRLHVEG